MATRWSNLPGDILSTIAKLLDTDVDLLRLRSVCSSWRSSLSPPKKRFPLKLPPPLRSGSWIQDRDGYLVLRENTLYRLSPPAYGRRAGDPSNGWLFKVSEISPNRFCLLNPLISEKMKDTEGRIPKTLNLLEYRISEICKSYSLDYVDIEEKQQPFPIKKVIVLWNYVTGCDFAVMLLPLGNGIAIWKFGDARWTHMDVDDDPYVQDVIQHGGKCYAIDVFIAYIDPSLNMTDVCSPAYHLDLRHLYLAKCGSDLYVVAKDDHPAIEYYDDINTGERLVDVDTLNLPLKMQVFKVSKESEPGLIPEYWDDDIEILEDKVFFLADDVSVGVSTKDFAGCKGNYICLNDKCFYDEGSDGVYGEGNGVYGFGEKLIEPFVKFPEYAHIFWPPPKWLMHD